MNIPGFGVNQSQQTDKEKAFRYRCVKNCTLKGKYYRQDEIIYLTEKKEVPHFEFVEEIK
jgi:hypothetical protein